MTSAIARRLLNGALCCVAAAAAARMVASSLGYGIPAWFSEELPPLAQSIASQQPVRHIDARQYGVVVFLVLDPWLRFFGSSFQSLAGYALVIALAAVGAAFCLVQQRFFRSDLRGSALLAIVWFGGVPTLYVVQQRMVDAWQLVLISTALVLWLSASPTKRALAGVPLATAALTKLLPLVLVAWSMVCQRRAAAVSLVSGVVLLAVGQMLYGPLMGFGYPLAILASGGSDVATWSAHYENNSLRGLLYKAASGFHLKPATTAYELPTDGVWLVNVLAYALALTTLLVLVVLTWRGRGDPTAERRAVHFSLAVTSMLLISPHTAHDYTVVMLPVVAIWLWLGRRRWPEPWGMGLVGLAVCSSVLLGVFVPFSLFFSDGVLPFLLRVSGNASNPVFDPVNPPLGLGVGTGIGAYDFFGFPGLGLVAGWVVSYVLDARAQAHFDLAHRSPVSSSADGAAGSG